MQSQSIRPEADVEVGNWTVFGKDFHWEALAEETSDAGGSYIAVSSSSNYVAELQNHGIPDDGSVVDIEFFAVMRRILSGNPDPSITLFLRSGSDYTLDTVVVDNSSFLPFSWDTVVSPFTGIAWTIAEARGLQFGLLYVPGGIPQEEVRVTQMYATVSYIPPTWTQKGAPLTM